MADTIKRNRAEKPEESGQQKSLKQLWGGYQLLFDQIEEKKAALENSANVADLSKIRAEISSLYLSAASYCISMLRMVNDEQASEEELVSLSGRDDIVARLRKRSSTYIDFAKKFGSSIKSEMPKTTLDDIKGQEDVKEVVRSFIFLAKHADLFATYKITGGLGMMMYGAPGTGKTMFAEAIAHEMQLPLFVISPADIFKSYVGASEQAVKQIFDDISAFSEGAILFVDECESIFTRRDKDSKDYKSAVTSELLQRMNGEGVDGSRRIMIAATNRPWDIDPAYLRYKRFSHLVHISPPDDVAIEAIVRSKLKGIPCEDGVEDYAVDMFSKSVNATEGEAKYYSAADVCGIVEEACRMAVEEIMRRERDGQPYALVKVSKAMVAAAINKRKPSITQKDMDEYNNFTPEGMNQ